MDLRTLRKPFKKVSRVWTRSELSRLCHIVYISSWSLLGKYWGCQRSPWKVCFSCTIMWVWGPHLSNAQMSRCCDWLMKNGGFRLKSWYPKLSKSWMIVLKPMISGIPGFCHVSVLRWVMEHRPDRVSKKERWLDLVFTLDLAGDVPNLPLLGGFMGNFWHRFCNMFAVDIGLRIETFRTNSRKGWGKWFNDLVAISDGRLTASLQVATASGSSGRPKKHKHIHIMSMFSTHGESDRDPIVDSGFMLGAKATTVAWVASNPGSTEPGFPQESIGCCYHL